MRYISSFKRLLGTICHNIYLVPIIGLLDSLHIMYAKWKLRQEDLSKKERWHFLEIKHNAVRRFLSRKYTVTPPILCWQTGRAMTPVAAKEKFGAVGGRAKSKCHR